MNNIIIYTAVFGGKDNIRPFAVRDTRARYVFVTDKKPVKEHGWEIITDLPFRATKLTNPRRLARYCKTHPHELFPDADATLWIDGIFTPNTTKWVEAMPYILRKTSVAAGHHYERDCSYEEADVCKQRGLDAAGNIDRQLQEYSKEKYPRHNGLYATGTLARLNNTEMTAFNETWWSRIELHSIRDQLSFNFLLWKHNIECTGFMCRIPGIGSLLTGHNHAK